MTEQIIALINRIKCIEQRIRALNNEKRRLENELNHFSIGDDGVTNLKIQNGKNSEPRMPQLYIVAHDGIDFLC
jgi:hypothetical protein